MAEKTQPDLADSVAESRDEGLREMCTEDVASSSNSKEFCVKEDDDDDSTSASDDDDDDDDDDEEEDFDYKNQETPNDYNRVNDFEDEDDDDDDSVDYDFVDQMLEEKYSSRKDNVDDNEELLNIDEMLEENVNFESLKQSQKRKHDQMEGNGEHQEKKRIVLIKHGQDNFEVLPEGWVEVTHFSGMPVYLHKQSRVCTLSRPYTLGSGSARKHSTPLSAVPCLQYRRELDKIKEKQALAAENAANAPDGSEPAAAAAAAGPVAKVETLKENLIQQSLDPQAFHEYCQNLFQFKQVIIRKFKTWAERRRHAQSRKRPTLPESTKLITLEKHHPGTSPGGKSGGGKKFIMNPDGKSVVCILHEYVQHAERTQPKYIFKELENVSKPYCATVMIHDKQYGQGFGASKKEAKNEAAKATLDILIPDLNKKEAEEDSNPKKRSNPLDSLNFFDDIKIEDSRVTELCMKAGQMSPYQILVECVRRNFGFDQLDIKCEVKMLKHQRNEFTLSCGPHQASVVCKNKREGKQKAAQAILKLLHPSLTSWGAILKLYGRGSIKTPKEKKEESLEITELQNKASTNKPNYAILEKLKTEMLKLKEEPPPLQTFNCSINL